MGSQLESLRRQTGVQATVFVHDDGSKDTTLEVLKCFRNDNPDFLRFDTDSESQNLHLTEKAANSEGSRGINENYTSTEVQKHLGAARGFWHLLQTAPDADYYAFCDQDDVWDADKLQMAVDHIEKVVSDPRDMAVYCCSQRLTDADGNVISEHRLNSKRSINSRLFYASISGNTVVFSRSLLEKAREHEPENFIMHDSWLIKLCIALGGKLIVDEEPHMDYRMHGSNEVGMELNLKQKIAKFKRVSDDLVECRELEEICRLYEGQIVPEIQKLAENMKKARKEKVFRREFLQTCGVDFKSRGFNFAFERKIRTGKF